MTVDLEPVKTPGLIPRCIGLGSFSPPAFSSAAQLSARGDAEFAEDLSEMPLDGPRTDEQPGCNLRVREAFADQPSDLRLLGGQLGLFLAMVLLDPLAGRLKLTRRPLLKR